MFVGRKSGIKRRKVSVSAEDDHGGDTDLITRIFKGIFGKKALEERKPFGMQRMSEESMHELYPATTTEFADPVSTDDAEMSLFRPLLAKTRLAASPLRWFIERIYYISHQYYQQELLDTRFS